MTFFSKLITPSLATFSFLAFVAQTQASDIIHHIPSDEGASVSTALPAEQTIDLSDLEKQTQKIQGAISAMPPKKQGRCGAPLWILMEADMTQENLQGIAKIFKDVQTKHCAPAAQFAQEKRRNAEVYSEMDCSDFIKELPNLVRTYFATINVR